MKWRGIIPTAVILVVAASGCEGPQVSQPSTGPLFARATRTPVTATITITGIADPGTKSESVGRRKDRDVVVTGTISGDIEGTITSVSGSTKNKATNKFAGLTTSTITTAGGTWEVTSSWKVVGGLLSAKFVAQGTGGLTGLELKGTVTQGGCPSPKTDCTLVLTGEILSPRS